MKKNIRKQKFKKVIGFCLRLSTQYIIELFERFRFLFDALWIYLMYSNKFSLLYLTFFSCAYLSVLSLYPKGQTTEVV